MTDNDSSRQPQAERSHSYPVGEVSRVAGVTVRTLHHYDEIGLLSPTGRSEAGYRLYERSDLDRLSQILFYRELDFPLEQIATILDEPDTDASAHLQRQRRLLGERIERLEALVGAIDRITASNGSAYQLSAEDKLEIFGSWTPPEGYADEAERSWSETDAWQRHRAEQRTWTRQDWEALEDRRRDFSQRLGAVMEAGLGPESAEAAGLVEELRQSLPEEYADMIVEGYVTRPDTFGFVVRPEDQRPGMAELLRDAFRLAQPHS